MSKSAKKRAAAPSASSGAVTARVLLAKGVAKPPKAEPGSKQSHLIAMLRSPAGATIAAMMKATGWQQHSVRGLLAGAVHKRLKLKLGSKKVDGKRVYRITGGEKSKSPSLSKRRPS
jgi:pyrroline-5-carboxylate reductase